MARKTRTAKLRRNLFGVVACVWCGHESGLTVHHFVPLSKGGTDDRDNRILLCPVHHRLIHLKYPGFRPWAVPVPSPKATARVRIKKALVAGTWLPVSQPPPEATRILIGHHLEQWVEQDAMYLNGHFHLRALATLHGPTAFEHGQLASPTHWMLPPSPPHIPA